MIIAYTDGSCLGNPGLGGMGIVLVENDKVLMEIGIPSDDVTTNNRMELGAAIYITKHFIELGVSYLHIITDSNYTVKGVNEWLHGWKKKDFKNVKNVDMWKEMDSLLPNINLVIKWVKGHSTNQFNNMADRIAVEAAKTRRIVQR